MVLVIATLLEYHPFFYVEDQTMLRSHSILRILIMYQTKSFDISCLQKLV